MPPSPQHHNNDGDEISASMSLKGINWKVWKPVLMTLLVGGGGGGAVKLSSYWHDDTAGRIEGSRIKQTEDLKASLIKTIEPLDKRITALEVSVVDMGKQMAALTQHLKDEDEMRRMMSAVNQPRDPVAAVDKPHS